jgi:sodium/proline symporter
VYNAVGARETAPMSDIAASWLAIAAYCLAMLAIGVWSVRRTRDAEEFFLGGRRLGPWVAALSQGATQSSAWTMVGVSGAAFAWGLPAVWIWLSVVAGYAVNWFWVAPRLRRMSAEEGSLTLVQLLAGRAQGPQSTRFRRSAAGIVVFSFLFYVAAQFQAAGQAFAITLHLPLAACIVAGSVVIVAYTLAGGFWAASVTDFVQALLMLLVAVVLPVAALQAAGGAGALLAGLEAGPAAADLMGGRGGAAAIAFVAGTMGIGLAAPGQPHVVNHFMAARDRQAIRRGGVIAIAWIALVLAGMLVVGWSAHLLAPAPARAEEALFAAAAAWLPPLAAALVSVAVLSAIMSTVDSQLITATSSLTLDWSGGGGPARARAGLLAFSAVAVAIAVFAPATIYSRVLFAWNALGAAFGPLVVLAVLGRRPAAGAALAGLWTGFLLTVAFYLAADAEGDVLERTVPFLVALVVTVAVEASSRSNDPASRASTAER